MKKVTDERLKAARVRSDSFLFYIQTSALIVIVLFDYVTHGTSYVMRQPILGVLFFTLFLSGVRSMLIAKDYTNKHGLFTATVGIISVDLVGLVCILLNLNTAGTGIFAILLLSGSLITFIIAFAIIRKGRNTNDH